MGFKLRAALTLVFSGALVVGALVVGVIHPLMKDASLALEATETRTVALLAELAKTALLRKDYDTLQAMIERVVQDPFIDAVIVSDQKGRIVAASDRKLLGLAPVPLDEVPGYLWLTLPIQGEAAPLGLIDVRFSLSRFERSMAAFKRILWTVGLGGLLGVFVLSWLTAAVLTRRLGLIVEAAERVIAGDFKVKLPVKGRDEVAHLARAFDHMLKRLDSAMTILKETEERYRLAVEGSEQAIWEWRLDDNRVFFSERLAEILGYSSKELPFLFNGFIKLIHPEDRPRFEEMIRTHLDRGEPFRIEIRLRRKRGGWTWVALRGKASQGRVLGSCVDITSSKEAQARLTAALARFRTILEALGEGVVLVDEKRRIQYLNPQATKIFGGKPQGEKIHRFLSRVALQPMAPGEPVSFGFSLDGRFFEGVASSVPGGGAVIAFRDVTERHRLMERLAYQSSHDDVTGLYNRKAFMERLTQGGGGAIAFLDIDGFGAINDRLGDEAGDALLREVAGLLETKAEGFLARIGGDEFALLMEGVSFEEARKRARRLSEEVARLRFKWEKSVHPVSVSVGILEFGAGLSPEEVMGFGDHCLHLAKEAGWGGFRECCMHDPRFATIKAHQESFHALERAFQEHRLILFAQPIVSLQGEEDIGHFEILLRVKDETGKIVSPAPYLEAAERYRFSTRVDRFVVESAVNVLSALGGGNGGIRFSINLSGASLGDREMLPFIRDLIEAHRLSPSSLIFEITETVAISDLAAAQTLVKELGGLGCYFALDDFGSGFASFAYLKDLQVNYLKVDGSFVQGMKENILDKLVVEAACRVGHAVGAKVIAEFVDDEDKVSLLKSLGVDYAQGYYFGRPVPLYEAMSEFDPHR